MKAIVDPNFFTNLLKNNSNKKYSRNTFLRVVFLERFNRKIRDLLTKPAFQRGDANWIDVLPTLTKRYNNKTRSSTTLTGIQAL